MTPRTLHGSGSARGTSVSASRCEVMRSTIELWKTTLCSSHALKPADARWRPFGPTHVKSHAPTC